MPYFLRLLEEILGLWGLLMQHLEKWCWLIWLERKFLAVGGEDIDDSSVAPLAIFLVRDDAGDLLHGKAAIGEAKNALRQDAFGQCGVRRRPGDCREEYKSEIQRHHGFVCFERGGIDGEYQIHREKKQSKPVVSRTYQHAAILLLLMLALSACWDSSLCWRERQRVPQGLKPGLVAGLISVRAEARTYLRSQDNGRSRFCAQGDKQKQKQIPPLRYGMTK